MEAAGIPRTRRRRYRGHGPKDVSDLYEEHEVSAALAEDRDRLFTYLKRASGIRLEARPARGPRASRRGITSCLERTRIDHQNNKRPNKLQNSRGGTRTPDPVINSQLCNARKLLIL